MCGDIHTAMKSCVGMALHEELLLADRQEVVKDLALFNRSSSECLCCCCCCSSEGRLIKATENLLNPQYKPAGREASQSSPGIGEQPNGSCR